MAIIPTKTIGLNKWVDDIQKGKSLNLQGFAFFFLFIEYRRYTDTSAIDLTIRLTHVPDESWCYP
ncbi:hypothetical protein IFU39_28655 [Paenibacillus sp. CFBP 13594]|uniref:hypothetical protein n=1 Tax=Paenibacillus sp. CFBP 13594 TaxID=2774037 RepID=UPI0017820CC4|nr:hypothetical protein [Paenibacillus sp. CFBP 13594]MBD8841769.1 hypothetical protein [Paenibacillus sp. CFBP 13594]